MPGKAISKANMQRIQSIHDHSIAMGAQTSNSAKRFVMKAIEQGLFDRIDGVRHAMYAAISMAEAGECWPYLEDVYEDYAIIELDDIHWKATYLVATDGSITLAPRADWIQVEEVWQPVTSSAKGLHILDDDADDLVYALKALGDREIELKIAWGYDSHKERFHPSRTDFDLEHFPTPPVAYYHGFKADGKPSTKPVYIGKTLKRENRADGHYITAKLNDKPEADKVWNASLAGSAFVSPGTIGYLRRKDPDGTLTYWPVAEISAWDGAANRKQAHRESLAFPVLKALYLEAGLTLPANIAPSEVAGDATSAALDIDPAIAARAITQEVTAALRSLTRKPS